MSNYDNRKAIVLDTNFIIANKSSQLKQIVEELAIDYDVYITQVSLNERQSQRYLEHKTKYENLEQFKTEYYKYADIEIKIDFDSFIENDKKISINAYEKLFGDHIISFTPTTETLAIIIDRANKKIPPFSAAKNSSDKGFKDTLIWFSILNYFESKTDVNDILFLTDDNMFINQEKELQEEFKNHTGRNINIHNNAYYASLLKTYEKEKDIELSSNTPITEKEKNDIRANIKAVMEHIVRIEFEDGWDTITRDTFNINNKLDSNITLQILESLPNFLKDNMFSSEINASALLGNMNCTIKDNYTISITFIEDLLKLYNQIKDKYSNFLQAFINAVCNIINENYEEEYISLSDLDLPF